MRVKSKPTRVLQNYEEREPSQYEGKFEIDEVKSPQVSNLRQHLSKDRSAKFNGDYATLDKGNYDDHLSNTHPDNKEMQKQFKCDQCEYSTKNPGRLTEHKNAHGGIKANKCEFCDFATCYKSNLYQHRKMHLGTKTNPRDFASKKPNLDKGNRNTQPNATPVRHKCSVCKFETARRRNLRKHMKRMHELQLPLVTTLEKSASTSRRETAKVEKTVATEGKSNEGVVIGVSSAKLLCNQCDHIAPNQTRLTEHMNGHFAIKDKKCDHCTFSTSFSFSLRRHIKRQHDNFIGKMAIGVPSVKKLSCSQCDHIAPDQARLTEHTNSHFAIKDKMSDQVKKTGTMKGKSNGGISIMPSVKKLSCDQCDHIARNQNRLIEHMYSHLGIKDKRCDHCTFSTSFSHNLKRHIKALHPEMSENFIGKTVGGIDKREHFTATSVGPLNKNRKGHLQIKYHKCDECSFATSYGGNLKQHIKSVHRKGGLHSCPYSPGCQFKKSTPETILRHITMAHVKVTTPPQAHDKISKRSPKQSTLALTPEYRTGHLDVKKNKCNHCSFTTFYRGNLNQHIRSVHGSKHLRCILCNFATSYKKSLNFHLKAVHGASEPEEGKDNLGVKENNCNERNAPTSHSGDHDRKSFNTHSTKAVHGNESAIDTQNGDFQLKNCRPVVLLQRMSRKRLEDLTSTNQSLKCDQCDFSSVNAVKLTEHKISAHGKVEANRCEYCDFATSKKYALSQHRKIHRKDNLFGCPYNSNCNLVSTTFVGMRNHISKKHPDESSPSGVARSTEKKSPANITSNFTDQPATPLAEHKCDECNFSSARRGVLAEHLNAHKGIKNHQCRHCGFATCYKNNLYKHMKSQHRNEWSRDKEIPTENVVRKEEAKLQEGSEKYKVEKYTDCLMCGFSTDDQADLNAHLMKNHVVT